MSKDIVRRVGEEFYEKIVNIQKTRKNNGKSFMSIGKLTNMIPKHNSWALIKKDLEELS